MKSENSDTIYATLVISLHFKKETINGAVSMKKMNGKKNGSIKTMIKRDLYRRSLTVHCEYLL